MSDFMAELDSAITAFFSELGQDAVFTPQAGGPVDVKVRLVRPDITMTLGETSAVLPDAVVRVAMADLQTQPRKGDTFVIGDETFTVVERARVDDENRKIWAAPVEKR